MKYYEVKFVVDCADELRQDACDLMAALAGDTGFETFEESADGIVGYVQVDLLDRNAIDAAIADFPMPGVVIAYDVREADYRDWNEQWEAEGFEPIVVGGECCVHDGRHLPSEPYAVEVAIDARLAFGTGNHDTTRLMIEGLLATPMQGKRVLDCGCGTGILGIVALKRGAESVVGYDIDEWSVANTRANADGNVVGDRYAVMLGDASLIASMPRPFDVVVANIARNVLLADMPAMAEAMASGATLMLSGFYVEDAEPLQQMAAAMGLRQTSMRTSGQWAMLEFVKE